MDEVWVVYWMEYEDWNIEGVFDSLGAADAYVRGREDVTGVWDGDGGRMWAVARKPHLTWFADRHEVRHG